jgi:hypothetical protein
MICDVTGAWGRIRLTEEIKAEPGETARDFAVRCSQRLTRSMVDNLDAPADLDWTDIGISIQPRV